MNRVTTRATRTLTIALLASTLLAAFPAVEAGPYDPVASGWSPFATTSLVRGVALSKGPGTESLVAGLALSTESGGAVPPPPPSTTDLYAFNATSGVLFAAPSAGVPPTPEGKTAVAVSRDGKFAVAAGPRRSAGSGENAESNAPTGVLSYFAIGGAAEVLPDGSPGFQDPRWDRTMPGPVSRVAISANGARIAVAANPTPVAGTPSPLPLPVGGTTATPEVGRVLVVSGEGSEVFRYATKGRVGAVDISADGQWTVAGGRWIENNRSNGVVLLFRAPSAEPVKRFFLSPENASEVRDVRITPDGKSFAAVTQRGDVYVWQNEGASTGNPVAALSSATNSTRTTLALSEDGRFVVSGAGQNVRLFEVRAGSLALRWTHLAPAAITAVDANATAAIIVATVEGAQGGIFAFSQRSATPFWQIAGASATNGTISSKGDRVAYATGLAVHSLAMKRNLTMLYEGAPGVGSATQAPATTQPFRGVTIPILVRNDGSIPQRLAIAPQATREDVTVVSNVSRVTLVPGEVARVGVTVTPGRLQPGVYSFNVTTRSLDASNMANLSLKFEVTGFSEIGLNLNGAPERYVGPGGSDSILLGLFNNGNSAANVTVTAFQTLPEGQAWSVRLVGESRFPLASGATGTVRVLVDVPQDATNGTENRVTIAVQTPRGTSSQEVLYRVNPFVAVNVTLTGRTKFVYPASSVQFNVTVKNTGSIAAQFEASVDTRAVGGKNWPVDVDIRPFTLAPGENRTIPVRVVAPADALIGERAIVVFEARSLPLNPALKGVAENLTLIANLAERPPNPENPGTGGRFRIPAASPLAVLAAISVAILVVSTRKVKP